jgi:hypothetical protein
MPVKNGILLEEVDQEENQLKPSTEVKKSIKTF